jgi:ABC-type multidrug transport system fused ATPase/permease subunit
MNGAGVTTRPFGRTGFTFCDGATGSPHWKLSLPLCSRDQWGALSAVGLSKHFGPRVAFDEVTFRVGRSEVFGFFGPNGAGKTTTVRTLATLVVRLPRGFFTDPPAA